MDKALNKVFSEGLKMSQHYNNLPDEIKEGLRELMDTEEIFKTVKVEGVVSVCMMQNVEPFKDTCSIMLQISDADPQSVIQVTTVTVNFRWFDEVNIKSITTVHLYRD